MSLVALSALTATDGSGLAARSAVLLDGDTLTVFKFAEDFGFVSIAPGPRDGGFRYQPGAPALRRECSPCLKRSTQARRQPPHVYDDGSLMVASLRLWVSMATRRSTSCVFDGEEFRVLSPGVYFPAGLPFRSQPRIPFLTPGKICSLI